MQRISWLIALFILAPSAHAADKKVAPVTSSSASVDGIALKTIDGNPAHLSDAPYFGKVLLVVNTASQCGYTPQYEGLEKLHSRFKDKGFAVLGFPSNDFGGQEPGSDAEIKQFCTSKFKVDFPLFAKGPVKGDARQPLYSSLLAQSADHAEPGWNFEKYLLGRDHKVIAHWKSGVTPDSQELISAVEAALDKKL